MLGLRLVRDNVSRVGTLCGVLAMLVLVTGCPPPQIVPCTVDANCDDGLFCTGVETCNVDTGDCVAGTAPCEADYCDEDNDVCLECLTDADCDDDNLCTDDTCVDNACVNAPVDCPDDGEFCNGTEACDDATGECASSGDPCAAGETCNEEEDRCDVCAADAECDDTNLCTDDACVDGQCENTPVVCEDDGLFCTGVEECDPADGLCKSSGDPCDPATETCNEETDTCDPGTPCVEDTDCLDDLFCNGVETCGMDGFCLAGTDPCDDGLFCNGVETCDEDNNVCLDGSDPCDPVTQGCDEENDVCTEVQQFVLTTEIDVLQGTEGADVFRGTDDTADTGDLINGRGGVDRFDLITSGEENDLIDTVGLEQIFVRNTFANQEIDLSGFADFTELWFDRGTESLLLDNVPALAAVGYTGGNGDGDFEVAFDNDLVDGGGTTLDIFLDGAEGNDLIFDGFEIFNVNLSGDNELDDLVSNDLETVNFLGGSSLEVNDVIDDATDFDASGSSADIDITVDDEDITYVGGSGTDVVRFGVGEFDEKDDVDGGDGDSDMVVITLDDNVSDPALLSNTEIVSVSGDNTGGSFVLEMTDVTGVDRLRFESLGPAGTPGTLEIDALTLGPEVVFRGTGDDEDQVFDSIMIGFEGTSDPDALAVTVNNRNDEDLDDNNRTITIGSLDIDYIEDLALSLNDGGDLTITDLFGEHLESVTIVANSSVTVTNPLESTEMKTVDAGATDGGVSVDISNSSVRAVMTGGSGNDTLICGEADDDTLDGGEGDDILRGGPGDDDLDGGEDADTFQWNDGDEGVAGDITAADSIDDFSLTGDDKISIEDAGALDVVGVATLAFSLEGTSAAGDNVVVFNATEAVANTAVAIEDVILNGHGVAGEAIIAVVLADDNLYVVYDNDSGAPAVSDGAGILILAEIDELDGDEATVPSDLDDFAAANFELR